MLTLLTIAVTNNESSCSSSSLKNKILARIYLLHLAKVKMKANTVHELSVSLDEQIDWKENIH